MLFEAAINIFAAVRTRRELWDHLVEQMASADVTMVAYHATDTDGRLSKLAHHGFPQQWVERYMANDLYKDDPFPELAASMQRPFYWRELPDIMRMTPGRQKFLNAMKETAVGDGIALYLYGPRFQNAFMGLGFGKPMVSLSNERLFELQCLAQAAHLRYCMISQDRAATGVLTKRETEVLELIAVGKSNSIIAQILTMSPHTVDSHVRKIFNKLGVADRTTAALRGLGRGLIHM